jgi:hypothetical protein
MASGIQTNDFTMIRVRKNGPRHDGSPPKNTYTVDVEVAFGVFPVQFRQSGRPHPSMPLNIHPSPKAIVKAAAALVADLEERGLIGNPGAVLELNAPSSGADTRTRATIERLREITGVRAKQGS